MLNQHPKKHRHAGTPNIVPDPLVDPGNPSHRYQARSTAHLDRPRSRMVALAASPPGPRSPRSPQAENATVMLGGRLDKTGTYANDGSRGEAVGKPGVAGVYTNQRLNLSKLWEGSRRRCQGLKPVASG